MHLTMRLAHTERILNDSYEQYQLDAQRFHWIVFGDDLVAFDVESGETFQLAAPCGAVVARIVSLARSGDRQRLHMKAITVNSEVFSTRQEVAALAALQKIGLLSR